MTPKDLRQTIKDLFDATGASQRQVAEEVGMSESNLSYCLSGRHNFSPEKAEQIISILQQRAFRAAQIAASRKVAA